MKRVLLFRSCNSSTHITLFTLTFRSIIDCFAQDEKIIVWFPISFFYRIQIDKRRRGKTNHRLLYFCIKTDKKTTESRDGIEKILKKPKSTRTIPAAFKRNGLYVYIFLSYSIRSFHFPTPIQTMYHSGIESKSNKQSLKKTVWKKNADDIKTCTVHGSSMEKEEREKTPWNDQLEIVISNWNVFWTIWRSTKKATAQNNNIQFI